MADQTDLVDAMLVAPAGAALLAAIDAGALRSRRVEDIGRAVPEPTTASIAAALDDLAATTIEDLLEVAVYAAATFAGPWSGDAPALVARCLRGAADRRSLAEAIAERFGAALGAGIDRNRQAWW